MWMNVGRGAEASAGVGDGRAEHTPRKTLLSFQVKSPRCPWRRDFSLHQSKRASEVAQRATLFHFMVCFCNQLGNSIFKLNFSRKKNVFEEKQGTGSYNYITVCCELKTVVASHLTGGSSRSPKPWTPIMGTAAPSSSCLSSQ